MATVLAPERTPAEILTSSNDLLAEHDALIERLEAAQQRHRAISSRFSSPTFSGLATRPVLPSRSPRRRKRSIDSVDSDDTVSEARNLRPDLPPIKRLRALRYQNYSPEEETIRNDYSQQYVDGGDWPQNFVQGAEPERRFEEYPKQQRLLNFKKQAVAATAHQPCYLPLTELQNLPPSKFDVILVDPPFSSSFTWDTLAALPVPTLAADPSFVFLWVGSGAGDGLERGREILYRWGYRRCEDVVWIKTNKDTNLGPGTDPPTSSLFARTKQHCLIGIRGTVRRSTDSWFVHCNVDTDVMFWEGDPTDPTRKPPETYTLVENFCLGLRRLELFGRTHSLRPGWVTVGEGLDELDPELGAVKWEREWWDYHVNSITDMNGRHVVPTSAEIEMLRPKSPVPRNAQLNPQRMNNPGGGGSFQHQHGASSMNSGGNFQHGSNRPTFGGMAAHNHQQAQMQMQMQHMGNNNFMPPPFQQQQQSNFGNSQFQAGPTPRFQQQQQFPGQQGSSFQLHQHQHHPPQPRAQRPMAPPSATPNPTSQPLNAFAAPFVPMGMGNVSAMGMGTSSGMNMDPNMAMMGGTPSVPGGGMGMMSYDGSGMPIPIQMQDMYGNPMGFDPMMMQQMMQMQMQGGTPMGMGGMPMGMGGVPMGLGGMPIPLQNMPMGGMAIGMGMQPPMHMQLPMNNLGSGGAGEGSGPGGGSGGGPQGQGFTHRAGGSLRVGNAVGRTGSPAGSGGGADAMLSATPMQQLQLPGSSRPPGTSSR